MVSNNIMLIVTFIYMIHSKRLMVRLDRAHTNDYTLHLPFLIK